MGPTVPDREAAEATEAASQSGEIGKAIEWHGTVRENISGNSTCLQKKQLADGMPRVVLVAIVIADGEELRASKAMCKLPRPGHYTVINT